MDDAELLVAWETALARVQPLRGVALLAAADADANERTLAELPLGEMARRVLRLHARWFGRSLAGTCACPTCGEAVEFECDATALEAVAPVMRTVPESITVNAHGHRVDCRLPAPLDLAHAARARDAADARRILMERCVIGAESEGVRCGAADLPADVTRAIAAAIEAADPLAEIGFALTCPECAAEWTATLEPERFLLAAVEGATREVMADVHTLARAYGWSEAETLALSRARRRTYIDMVGA